MGGSTFYRIFFIAYLMVAVFFVYNIMIAIIIDNITNKIDKFKEKSDFDIDYFNSF